MSILKYPLDKNQILKSKKSLKKKLLNSDKEFVEKNIAVLGGSTTRDIIQILELFLLDNGIKPKFYESEYNQYYQEAMFPNPELKEFKPDIIWIHTTNRNIIEWPEIQMNFEEVSALMNAEYEKYFLMWEKLYSEYKCPIIQNNFEYPYYRLLGNKDASDYHGYVNYITCLNQKFYEYTQKNTFLFINDINYQSSLYGLETWSNQFYWHMYKYAMDISAIPDFSFNLCNIIKSIFGKNKKGLVLDLDNTLWGGVIGDDGVDNIEIGQETSMGQAYSEFQTYLKKLSNIGILLNVNSKNEMDNAKLGLNHPDGILKYKDFLSVKANWNPKDTNFLEIAKELNILPESLVFVDDNPAERNIVCEQIKGVMAPELNADMPYNYISLIDRQGYFEVTGLSNDDLKRNEMYHKNMERIKEQSTFENYSEYLLSLKMHATIKPFEAIYLSRIAQLTNKSNQFNLTTQRYTQPEIEAVACDSRYITLYGKLIDKFGDNGVVSVVIGEIDGTCLHIRLWLMSCRVLKRDMEYAMMDELVKICKEKSIEKLIGYYYPTAKNGMVKDFYGLHNFEKKQEDVNMNAIWELDIDSDYKFKNEVIKIDK